MFQITRRFQYLALSTFIVLCPLVYTNGTGTTMRIFQEHFFELFGMALVCLFIGNFWISAFMALNVALYAYNGMEYGGSQILNIFVGSMIFMVSRKYFSKSTILDIRTPIVIVTAVTLVWMVFQMFHIDPIFIPQSSDAVGQEVALTLPLGSFALQAANGIYLLIASLIIALTNPFLALFMAIPIALSKSSAVFMSAGVVILFYTFYLYKRLFVWLSVASVLVFGLLTLKDLKTDPATFGSRLPMWHSVLNKSMQYPLGYGPDSFRNTGKHKNFTFNSDANQHTGIAYKVNDNETGFTYYSPSNDIATIRKLTDETKKNGLKWGQFNFWDDPHMEYLKILFEYGILGFLIMLGFLNDIRIKFNRTTKDKELITITSCLLVYFISSLTQFPLSLARTAYLFPILLGAFYSRTDIESING